MKSSGTISVSGINCQFRLKNVRMASAIIWCQSAKGTWHRKNTRLTETQLEDESTVRRKGGRWNGKEAGKDDEWKAACMAESKSKRGKEERRRETEWKRDAVHLKFRFIHRSFIRLVYTEVGYVWKSVVDSVTSHGDDETETVKQRTALRNSDSNTWKNKDGNRRMQ